MGAPKVMPSKETTTENVMVFVTGNRIDDPSSNTGRSCVRFTLR